MNIKQSLTAFHNFLLSDSFLTGLKTTIGCIVPSLILIFIGYGKYAIILAYSALLTSIVDSPGPMYIRFRAMLITLLAVLVFSSLITLVNNSFILTLLFLTGLSFGMSMLVIYGSRGSAVGTAVLLASCVQLAAPHAVAPTIIHGVFTLAGGLWYMSLSLVLYQLSPYLPLKQAMANSINALAGYLRIKAGFYQQGVNVQSQFALLVKQQSAVHESQQAVRELIFQTRKNTRESNFQSRILLVIFVELVDLFESIMSTYLDYDELQKRFGKEAIMHNYYSVITQMAKTLDDIAYTLRQNSTHTKSTARLVSMLQALGPALDSLKANHGGYNQAKGLVQLRNINANLQAIYNRIATIMRYMNLKQGTVPRPNLSSTSGFTPIQNYSPKIYLDNLNLRSHAFRHSVRVAAAACISFLIAHQLGTAHYYWVILTAIIILKPGYSATKSRNINRIGGTIVGTICALLVLYFVSNSYVLFFFVFLAMLAAYSLIKINYLAAVSFITFFVILVYHLMGNKGYGLIQERMADTFIGALIAIITPYIILPSWEEDHAKEQMLEMLNANKNYLSVIFSQLISGNINITEYKLARKNVFISTANLSGMLQRMLAEPKKRQGQSAQIHQFTVLNHILSSYAVSLYLNLYNNPPSSQFFALVSHNVLDILAQASECLATSNCKPVKLIEKPADGKVDTNLDQLFSIQKLSYDINLNIQKALRAA